MAWAKPTRRKMKKLAQCSVKAVDFITLWSGRFCSLLIIPIIAMVSYETFSRYFFNSPTTWAMELSTLVFGIYMIWSMAPSVLNKGQVAMDAFYNKWSPRTRAVVDSLTFGLVFIFCAAVAYESIIYAIESWQQNEHSRSLLQEPLYHWKAILAAGCSLFLLQALSSFIKNLWLAATGEDLL